MSADGKTLAGDSDTALIAYLSAFLVHMMTLTGVIVLAIPRIRTRVTEWGSDYVKAFAAGALLAAASLLVLPESFELIRDNLEDDSHVAFYSGAPMLAGIFTVLAMDTVIAALEEVGPIPGGFKLSAAAPAEDAFGWGTMETPAVTAATRARVLSAVLIGDTLHNFADGAFIGAAFALCTPAAGWAVVTSTVFHELSQELADFLILTSAAGLRPVPALVYNFASGVSIYAGVALVRSTPLSPVALGGILSFGAGVYVYTAAVECLPAQVQSVGLGRKVRMLSLFALGALCIAVVLVNHEHCDGGDHTATGRV